RAGAARRPDSRRGAHGPRRAALAPRAVERSGAPPAARIGAGPRPGGRLVLPRRGAQPRGRARRRAGRVRARRRARAPQHAGAVVGVHEPHGAADRDRGWQPLGRGRRRNHGAHPQDPPRERGVSRERVHRRGDTRRARRVRGGPAPQRGRGVMTRRTWTVAILGAWAASLGWLVKREFFRPTGARLAEAALSVPPGAAYYRLDIGG